MAGKRGNDAGTGPTPGTAVGGAGTSPRRYRRRLRNLGNVRTALADVLDDLENERVEPLRARAMVYALATAISVFREEREAQAQGELAVMLARLEGRDHRSRAIVGKAIERLRQTTKGTTRQ